MPSSTHKQKAFFASILGAKQKGELHKLPKHMQAIGNKMSEEQLEDYMVVKEKAASNHLQQVLDSAYETTGTKFRPTTPYYQYMDDLDKLEHVVDLEKKYHMNIPDSATENIDTPKMMAEFLQRHMERGFKKKAAEYGYSSEEVEKIASLLTK